MSLRATPCPGEHPAGQDPWPTSVHGQVSFPKYCRVPILCKRNPQIRGQGNSRETGSAVYPESGMNQCAVLHTIYTTLSVRRPHDDSFFTKTP